MKRKNKKGFTLVEIIICIALIGLIGTISIVTINIKDKNKLEEITNKIVEAANVYINVEKDEKGNTYSYGINNGAKGVQVSVKTLEEKGYISEDMVKTLEKESAKTEDLYVFVSNSIKDSSSQECSGSEPQSYTVSWVDTDEPIYLCPYTISGSSGSKMSILNKMLLDNEIKWNIPDLTNYKDEDKGLYILLENDTYVLYYYGKVENNYLRFNNMMWRIVRTNSDDTLRIVLDDTMPIYAEKAQINRNRSDLYRITSIESTGEKINITDKNIKCYIETSTWKVLCYSTEGSLPEYSVIRTLPAYRLNGDRITGYSFYIDRDEYVIPEFSVPLYILTYDDFLLYESFYLNYNSYLSKLQEWYSSNITDTEKVKKDFVYCNNYWNFNYNQVNFNCEETKSKREYISPSGIGMIGYKELKLSGGINSYLTDISKNFFTADFSSDYYVWYYDCEENKIASTKQYYVDTRYTQNLYQYKESGFETTPHAVNIAYVNDYFYFKPMGLRPVINLNEGTCFSGNGTESDPYVITEC